MARLADGVVVGSRAVQVAEEGPAALRDYVRSLREAIDAARGSALGRARDGEDRAAVDDLHELEAEPGQLVQLRLPRPRRRPPARRRGTRRWPQLEAERLRDRRIIRRTRPDRLRVETRSRELRAPSLLAGRDADQHVLRPDVAVGAVERLPQRQLHRLLRAGRERDRPRRRLAGGPASSSTRTPHAGVCRRRSSRAAASTGERSSLAAEPSRRCSVPIASCRARAPPRVRVDDDLPRARAEVLERRRRLLAAAARGDAWPGSRPSCPPAPPTAAGRSPPPRSSARCAPRCRATARTGHRGSSARGASPCLRNASAVHAAMQALGSEP